MKKTRYDISKIKQKNEKLEACNNDLSNLEKNLIKLLSTSETIASASEILGYSEHTLTLILASVRRKLGVETTFQAIAKAVYEGIVEVR